MKTNLTTIPSLMKFLVVAAFSVATIFVSTGCVAVMAAGAAGTGVAWYSGRLESTVDRGIDDVFKAAQKAVDQLEFARVSDKKSGVDGEIIARTALDKKIDITFEKAGERATKVQIRVGVFGDESLSLAILDKIKANL